MLSLFSRNSCHFLRKVINTKKTYICSWHRCSAHASDMITGVELIHLSGKIQKFLIYFRVFWFIVHMVGATIIVFMIFWSLTKQQANPFVTTLYDTAYPISDIDYPSIYICPNNIISRTRAEAYARRL